jgi:hypothetical protein
MTLYVVSLPARDPARMQQKTVLRLFLTVVHFRKLVNNIKVGSAERPSGNLMAWLYGCLLFCVKKSLVKVTNESGASSDDD